MDSMDSWKEFDQNPISHSAAHHIVAIAELLDAYGYARVSDVARMLEITRGSVSVTLKGLKQRGLVTEDERRFLGLSDVGTAIAQSVQARKVVMKKLFQDVLGVEAERADRDTCKIEHLVSPGSALQALHFLRYMMEDTPRRREFLQAFESFAQQCDGNPQQCSTCDEVCLQSRLTNLPRIDSSAESDGK